MAVLSVTPGNVDRVVSDIKAAGAAAIGIVCDIADPNEIKASVDQVLAAYGRIDILVNNAFDPYHDKHFRVIRKVDRFWKLDLAVLDGPFIGRGLHGCYFTLRPEIELPSSSYRRSFRSGIK